jgi:hypothetical protein
VATQIDVMQLLTHSDFVRLALAEFPELREDLEAVEEMPTLAASIFASRLQRAKGTADWDSYERGIRLLASLWESADPALQTALGWGVMKGLDFEGPRGPVAWEYLTSELRQAWQSTHGKVEALTALPRKGKNRRNKRR